MRFEIKFAFAARHDDRVETWVRTHLAGFRAVHPPRRVNNVYFDTADLQAFAENLAGISRRCKVRLRWYGEDDLPAAGGTLEFKHKHAALGWKDGYGIAQPWLPGDDWRAVHRRIRAALPPETWSVFDEHRHAALVNRYRRRYFASAGGRLRITLDGEQVMFDQTASAFPNTTRRIPLPDVHVLEVKCDARHRRDAEQALQTCPVRGSRFSKYTVGVELR